MMYVCMEYYELMNANGKMRPAETISVMRQRE
jgi:hypothetical protein